MRVKTNIAELFQTLSVAEQNAVLSHGAAIRLSDLKHRHFLAQSKVRHFEEKYQTTLAQLESDGLPEQADYEMHEDYIMWHHWDSVAERVQKDVEALENIVQQGLYTTAETAYAGD
jgi:hypothetical protein